MDRMQYRRSLMEPTSTVRGTRPSVLGGPAGSASPRLGMKVALGAPMGVSIRDVMRLSEALGVRVVGFSREVREHPRDVPLQSKPKMNQSMKVKMSTSSMQNCSEVCAML